MSLIDNPDPRSAAAIEAKRKWLRGEIDDSALAAAQAAAQDAARAAARASARAAEWASAWAAVIDCDPQKLIDILVKLINESYGGKTC